jgi:hypothetical protein
MEHTRAPIQRYYLFKSVVIMLVIQAIIVLFLPMALTAPIRYQLLAVNIAVATVLGWFLYKQWYHIEFSYGEAGFQLKKGKNPSVRHQWSEFSKVSLAKNEYGDFTIRLYDDSAPVEIPASKLRMDAFQLRREVLGYTASRPAVANMVTPQPAEV